MSTVVMVTPWRSTELAAQILQHSMNTEFLYGVEPTQKVLEIGRIIEIYRESHPAPVPDQGPWQEDAAVEATINLINRVPDVHAIYMDWIKREIRDAIIRRAPKAPEAKPEIDRLQAENLELRRILVECANALPGAYAHPEVSVEFLANVPNEVRACAARAENGTNAPDPA